MTTINQLSSAIKSAKKHIPVITLTPSMAKELIDNTTTPNRTLAIGHINKIADDILSGNWVVHCNGITLDTKCNVIDGQHRLHAVMKANRPIDIPVFIVDNDSVSIGGGNVMPRRLAGHLKILGVKSHNETAHMVSRVSSWKRVANIASVFADPGSLALLVNEFKEHEDGYESARKIAKNISVRTGGLFKFTDIAGLIATAIIYRGHSSEEINEFFSLANKDIPSNKKMYKILYNYMFASIKSPERSFEDSRYRCAQIISFWNTHVLGGDINKLPNVRETKITFNNIL